MRSSSVRLLVIVQFLLLLLHHYQHAEAAVNLTTYPASNTAICMSSLLPPQEPRPLEFCYWLNDVSCCTPANDAAAKAAFQDFTDLGPGCAPTDHKIRAAYREVRQFACLPCDPLEPRYRVDLTKGDVHLGGQIAADASANAGDFAWRVCRSFVFGKDGKSGLWGNNGSKFDACGIKPAGDSDHDFLVPSVAFGGSESYTLATDFVNVLPAFLSNFKAIVVNDTDPGFDYNATPCFMAAPPLHAFVVAAVMLLVLVLVAVII